MIEPLNSGRSVEPRTEALPPVSDPAVVPFPTPIDISCATKDNGPLTKIMRLDPETGALIKDGTECSMSTGTLTRLTISSLEGFAQMLRSHEENQALIHGIYLGAEKANITVKSKVTGAEKNGYPLIARTKEFIVYPDGPGVMLFDHDKARDGAVGSAAALASYRPDALLEILATIHQELAKAGWVSSPSTSSCIYDSAGNMLRGEGTGSHIYLFPKLASDIPRYLATLGKRLCLAGLDRIEVSKAGSLLQRTLIDLSVGSPERLDFVAGADCRDGLVQKLPEPTVHNGEMLDTTTLLDLTPEEERQYQAIVQALKHQARPQQERVVAEYIEHEAAKLAKDGITLEDAKSIVQARQNHVLEDPDILFFNGKTGTVREVLDNGVAYHGKSLADPLEPDYEGGSKTKAKFFWNDGNPIINSYAHGATRYRFYRYEQQKTEEKVDDYNEILDRYVFVVSENKIIDTTGHDIKESMMVERAFVVSQAGKYHSYKDENGNEKTIPLAQHWLQSDEKKVASSLKYSPGKPLLFSCHDGRTYFNTFRFPHKDEPLMTKAQQSRRLVPWAKILDTVFHEHRSYIEDFLSFTIQQPEKRAGIMPVCFSDAGLGKSLIMATMGRVIGYQNFSNGKILDVTGLGRSGTQWGDWIFNKKLSCIEEIDPEGETGISYKVLDALKDIITNETLSINLKGGRNGTFPVYSNIMGFSNHRDCMKIPFGDRRIFVVDSTEQKLLSPDEYSDLLEWMGDNGNIVAVFQYLRDREISKEFIPGRAKMTHAKQCLQTDGRSTMQSAFDLVIKHFPCDLITMRELQTAVRQAMIYMENGVWDITLPAGHEDNFNADKQFAAIMKSSTMLWSGGSRVRVKRAGGVPVAVRVLRQYEGLDVGKQRRNQDRHGIKHFIQVVY
jgi:Family of unknown function (DUF5906)